MRETLSGADIMAELLLIRSNFAGTLLILEGETDCRLFDGLINGNKCKTIPGHGKDSVLEAIQEAGMAALGGVAAIVDADYWHLEGVDAPAANVFMTDDHDLEMVMLNSPALDRLLRQFGSSAKIARFSRERAVDHVREFLTYRHTGLGQSTRRLGSVVRRLGDPEVCRFSYTEVGIRPPRVTGSSAQ